jgi:p-cumate 2,3-dioxygenase subunit alpha
MQDGSNGAGLILDDREDGIFRVHRSVFVDREIFEQERALIFDRSWLFAGHVSEFPNRGDFVTRSVAGRPVILAHGDDGKIRALMNTCRHRGNLVCRQERGTGAEFFRCFYHGWIYGTCGDLRGVPGEEAYSDAFDRSALGLESAPRMCNHRGCIFVSFDPEIESFERYMGDALAVFDNTLDLGDMEFVHGQFKYSMRANWKLLVENSMDGYHAAYTHERFFSHWLKSEGLAGARPAQQLAAAARNDSPSNMRRGTVPLGNGHVTTYYPCDDGRPAVNRGYLEKHAGEDLHKFRAGLVDRYGLEKARKVEGGAGNYLIFPNLMVIDGWWVFRTFYPSSPDYMEINGWACLPKNDPPALRKARLEWYLAFQGPGGFATPDDVEGLEGCQMGFAAHKEVEWSDISRGMKGNLAGGPGELQMRVFWREWHARMTKGTHADCTDD